MVRHCINLHVSFSGFQLPIKMSEISSKSHKVTVGLSDAFYFDTTSSDGMDTAKIICP